MLKAKIERKISKSKNLQNFDLLGGLETAQPVILYCIVSFSLKLYSTRPTGDHLHR